MSDNDPYTLHKEFNNELAKLTKWLSINKLILNVKKTNYMVFTKRHLDINFDIKIGNESINCASSLKFLGVTIDNKLSWHEHIGVICNQISKGVGILNKLRNLPQFILKTVYSAIILPYLNYCNIAWCNSTDYCIDRLFLLQKKAVRIISNSSYYAHTKPLFAKLKILNVFDLNDYNIACFMYLCFKNQIPCHVSSYFHLNHDIHNYDTRSSSKFHIPLIRTNVSKYSVFYKGPVIWNKLDNHIRDSPSLNCFKRRYNLLVNEN